VTEELPKKEVLKRLGFKREFALYCLLGILPVVALTVAILAFSWWEGLYFLLLTVFLVGFATVRFGMFLGLSGRQWLLVLLLFLAAYAGSFVYLLYRAYVYRQDPPPPPPLRRAEDDPRYHPKGDSLLLDSNQWHGPGGAGG
jgi:hypothetical protein